MSSVVAGPVAEGAFSGGSGGRALAAPKRERRAKVIRNLSDPNPIAEDDLALERQYYGIAEAFQPRNRWQEWLAARIATLTLRISRAERVERKLRDWASYRAFDFWEDDRKLAAEELGARLGRHPAKVAAQLRRSPAGLDWLACRWRALATLGPDDWTDERRGLAYQLLGGDERVDPAAPGFVAAQLEAIEADRGRVEGADAILRGLVESDLSDKDVPDLARLRREVRGWHRQIKWYADQFHVEHPDRWDDPMRRPAHEKATPDGFREVNYNLFEGPRPLEPLTPPPPSPAADVASIEPTRPELPPAAEGSAALAATRGFVETKPITPRASFTLAISASRPASKPVVHDYSNETGRGHARPRKAGEPSREYAKRLRRARRRANLALVELI